ncbi:MAG: HEAT repeat domain-containing protein [Lachnospiraceae bacterium]|nr:HEAT repeat domain-containing protein [Lachnospiraceae bacterium]
MRQDIVNMVVYLYIFICIALLLFNIAYILYSKRKEIHAKKRMEQMKKRQLAYISGEFQNKEFTKREKRALVGKLKKIRYLIAFEEALNVCAEEVSLKKVNEYLVKCREVIYETALEYVKRPAMERAYFGYFIATHMGDVSKKYQGIAESLLLYFADSTVYCQENVLQAFYVLGAEDALDQAFGVMKDSGYRHQYRLISDGLLRFRGNQYELAVRLWNNRRRYEESTRIGVIQFMTRLSEDFSEYLLPELAALEGEESFAVIRYFGSHHCQKAEPVLIGILQQQDEFSVPAAAVLANYPSESVKDALKQALNSPLWYVRKNAATSLLTIGLSKKEQESLKNSEDRYAREMFLYVLELQRKERERYDKNDRGNS